MLIYVAAPYAAREQVVDFAAFLREHGHECTSTWATSTREIGPGTIGPTLDLTSDSVTAHALGDFEDIDRSDALVIFTGQFCQDINPDLDWYTLHTGGRHVEVGYALAKEIPVIVVGPDENVFQRGLCLTAADWEDAVETAVLAVSLNVRG